MPLSRCALASVAVLVIFFSFPTSGKEPVRILAVGDSITQGGRLGVKEYTYRWPLERMLEDQGTCFVFVGSHRSGLDPRATWPHGWDGANEGYYGATTATVRDHLATTLPSFAPPDLALVHLGTNDRAGSVGADVIAPLREIVAMLRRANPKVVVLLAQIPAGRFRGAYLHFRLSQLAAEVTTSASPVLSVDQATGWDAARDTFDGVHPNLVGQRKMAERWLEAMLPYLRLSSVDGC